MYKFDVIVIFKESINAFILVGFCTLYCYIKHILKPAAQRLTANCKQNLQLGYAAPRGNFL